MNALRSKNFDAAQLQNLSLSQSDIDIGKQQLHSGKNGKNNKNYQFKNNRLQCVDEN